MPDQPTPADDRTAAAIRGLQRCGHQFAMLPLNEEEIREWPAMAAEVERWEAMSRAYRDDLLSRLGSDDIPKAVEFEGRIYTRKDGELVVRQA